MKKQFEINGIPTPPRMPKNSSGAGGRPGSYTFDKVFKPEMRAFERWMFAVKRELGTAPVNRTWCYIFEEMGWLDKGSLDKGVKWLGDMRKLCLIDLSLIGKDVARPVVSYGFRDTEETVMEKFQNNVRRAFDFATYNPHSYWEFQGYFPVVWSEKLDIIKMLKSVIPDDVVRLAGKGWSDINSRVQVMAHCQEAEENGLIPVILYLGDLDPVGVQIADTLRKNLKDLEDACEWWGVDDIIIERIGLTAEFVDDNELPWIPGLITSSGKDLANPNHAHHKFPHVQDYLSAYGPRKCEQNAMVLCVEEAKELLREALYTYLSEDGENSWFLANAEADSEMRVLCEQGARVMNFMTDAGFFSRRMLNRVRQFNALPEG